MIIKAEIFFNKEKYHFSQNVTHPGEHFRIWFADKALAANGLFGIPKISAKDYKIVEIYLPKEFFSTPDLNEQIARGDSFQITDGIQNAGYGQILEISNKTEWEEKYWDELKMIKKAGLPYPTNRNQ